MGDKVDTEEEKAIAQAVATEHMAKIVEKLKEFPPEVVKHAPEVAHKEYYYGHIIAIGELVDSINMTEEWIASIPEPEYSFGWYEVGRAGLIIDNIRRIEPVPAKGMMGLWEWEGL